MEPLSSNVMAAKRKKGLLHYVFRGPVYLYRWRLGWLLGHRFLMLTHVGRKSGLRRQTVLEVVEYRPQGPEVVVVSGFGRDADWFRNVQARPTAEIDVGGKHFIAVHRILGTEEAVTVLRSYEKRNWMVAPIVRNVLRWLLGWKYSGTDQERARVVEQLPMVAFRPGE